MLIKATVENKHSIRFIVDNGDEFFIDIKSVFPLINIEYKNTILCFPLRRLLFYVDLEVTFPQLIDELTKNGYFVDCSEIPIELLREKQ